MNLKSKHRENLRYLHGGSGKEARWHRTPWPKPPFTPASPRVALASRVRITSQLVSQTQTETFAAPVRQIGWGFWVLLFVLWTLYVNNFLGVSYAEKEKHIARAPHLFPITLKKA